MSKRKNHDAAFKARVAPKGERTVSELAACRRFADLGCSAPQTMAYSGHKNLKEVQTYSEAANRLGQARQALQMQVTADENRMRIVKPSGEV